MRTRTPWVLALLWTACPTPKDVTTAAPRKILISKIEAVDRTPAEDKVPEIDNQLLLKRVRGQLTSDPAFELLSKHTAGAYRFQLDVGLARRTNVGKDELTVLVSARAQKPDDPEGIVLHHSRMMPLGKNVNPKQAVLRAVDAALEEIKFQGRLVIASPDQLIKQLAERSAHRLAAVVEVIAQRKIKNAVPHLLRLLKHEDETVSDPVIGALVAIGDQRAVKALTRLSKFNDTERMAKILDAIGSLGGTEAEEYLQFVASGHEDADIRNMAAEALERMGRQGMKRKSP